MWHHDIVYIFQGKTVYLDLYIQWNYRPERKYSQHFEQMCKFQRKTFSNAPYYKVELCNNKVLNGLFIQIWTLCNKTYWIHTKPSKLLVLNRTYWVHTIHGKNDSFSLQILNRWKNMVKWLVFNTAYSLDQKHGRWLVSDTTTDEKHKNMVND